MNKRTITFLIIIFILFIAVLIHSELSRKRNEEIYNSIINESNKREKVLKLELEQLKDSYKILDKKYQETNRSYIEAYKNVDKANKKYEKVRNSRPIAYNDKQVDSILNRYYSRPK